MDNDLAIQEARPRLESIEGGLRVRAPAKINLNLLVGPRRADGFHAIDSYVAKVTLYDRIDLLRRDDSEITLACEGTPCGPNEQNLALRAARLLADAAGGAPGADIRLTKRIPAGTGLGGASSDAAAVLEGLTKLWDLAVQPAELAEMAAALGSDVPLFLGPPAARMTGRGECLTALELPPLLAVLVVPAGSCPTPEVYSAFDETAPETAPPADRQLPPELLSASPPSVWRDRLVNDLAGPAGRVCPQMAAQRRRLADALGLAVCVTGSGSGLFVLCDDESEAARAWRAIPADLRAASLVVCCNPW